jgi:hypothetical protein
MNWRRVVVTAGVTAAAIIALLVVAVVLGLDQRPPPTDPTAPSSVLLSG